MNNIIIWLTGLPCSGKTTIAQQVAGNTDAVILDGDTIRARTGNCDFSYEGRVQQSYLVASMAKDHIQPVIVALVSPFHACRNIAQSILKDRYIEVYVKCSLKTCVDRDIKGMYKKAMSGEIKDFTGISSRYEEPQDPHLTLNTERLSIEQCTRIIQSLL